MRRLCVWLLTLCLVGCGSQSDKTLKVAATAVPHAEILYAIKPDLKADGIHLEVVEVDDYSIPNRLLAEKQVDANFFQHKPFLDEQKKLCGYALEELAKVHIEPLGLYSERIDSLDQLSVGSTVAIPSDPTNEERALNLLVALQLITLKPLKEGEFPTVFSIASNPYRLKIREIDAAFLPRALADVTAAVIPANFALQAHLNPTSDALALEDKESSYANIVVIREDDTRESLQLLKKHIQSDKVRALLKERYQGALLPAF